MKPSNFKTWPWSCVFKNAEHEQVALNIITILARTGNEWREMLWPEYLAEGIKDGGNAGHIQRTEQDCFYDVAPYTVSAEAAATFSPTWSNVALGPINPPPFPKW